MVIIVEAQSGVDAPMFTAIFGRYQPGLLFKAVSYIVKLIRMFSVIYLDSYIMV
jgi:hypothetical protein